MQKLTSQNIFDKIKNPPIHSWFKSIGLFKQEEDKFPDAIKYEARWNLCGISKKLELFQVENSEKKICRQNKKGEQEWSASDESNVWVGKKRD